MPLHALKQSSKSARESADSMLEAAQAKGSKASWSLKRLGDVLARDSRPVDVDPNALYKEIGIRSHCKGIFHKPPVLGSTLGDKRVFEVVPDALVLNIVFAWEQAVAVTSANEAGMIASHRFPMYTPQGSNCDVNYLRHFFATARGKKLLEIASPGGAGRNKTLGQKEFEQLLVPMPSTTSEQTHIAALLTAWEASIGTALRLIENAKQTKRALLQRLLPKVRRNEQLPPGWHIVRMGDVVTMNPSRPSLPGETMVSFVPMKAVSENGRLIKNFTRRYDEVATGFSSFSDGDLLVAKITPCFENGKGALLSGLVNGVGFGSTEFIVLRPHEGTNSKLLHHVVNSHEFRRRGESEMEGSAGQKRVSPAFIKSFRFACPKDPLLQEELADMLDAADRVIDVYVRLHGQLQLEAAGVSQAIFRRAKAATQ